MPISPPISHWIGQSVESGAEDKPMPSRSPRHLAEHRLPWRLMLVAFGLTFAVLAALVASAALVPEEPLVPSAVPTLPPETTITPYPTEPPSVAPSSAGPGPT